MEKIKGITDIFFDLDHTLWDFKKNSSLTFEYLLKKYKIDIDLNTFLKIYIPINFSYWKLYRDEKITKEFLRHNRLKSTFQKLNLDVKDKVIDQISDDYIFSLPNNNFLIKNGILILDYLMDKYKLHIITNGFAEVQSVKLTQSGMRKYFDKVITSEEAGVKKPDPQIFLHAFKEAGAKPSESIMIGDDFEVDILGAKNVGAKQIFFDPNFVKKNNACD